MDLSEQRIGFDVYCRNAVEAQDATTAGHRISYMLGPSDRPTDVLDAFERVYLRATLTAAFINALRVLGTLRACHLDAT